MQEVVKWAGILIAMFIAFWLVWSWARRRYISDTNKGPNSISWTMQDLREMREEGKITEAEFESLKRQLIANHGDTVVEASDKQIP